MPGAATAQAQLGGAAVPAAAHAVTLPVREATPAVMAPEAPVPDAAGAVSGRPVAGTGAITG